MGYSPEGAGMTVGAGTWVSVSSAVRLTSLSDDREPGLGARTSAMSSIDRATPRETRRVAVAAGAADGYALVAGGGGAGNASGPGGGAGGAE
jgi:hypothetical protein